MLARPEIYSLKNKVLVAAANVLACFGAAAHRTQMEPGTDKKVPGFLREKDDNDD